MENFVIITTFLLIGMTLRHIPEFPNATGSILNLFVIYISLPALVLLKIPELIFSEALLLPALMPWGALLLSFTVILIFSKALKWNRSTTGCLLLLIPLGNTAFLGIPMVKTFFGEQGIPYALIYDQIGSSIALVTYGSLILAIYGSKESKVSITAIVKKIIKFPPFIALILAFSLKAFAYPSIAIDILKILSSTLVPLVMIAVGFQLTLQLDRRFFLPLSIGLFVKLILTPLTALLFCKSTGINGSAANISIFQAGMPPMVSAGALAITANLSPALAAALVGLGIILSFATLPLLYQML